MDWIKDAVFYNIYPLGFCGAPKKNDGILTYRLDKMYDFIDHFKKLGVNAIVFNPVFESSCHGYDTIDYKKIDCRLGDNESFKKICDTLHQNGIRVLLDGVFNHVGRDFFAFKDLQQNGMSSIYCNWFHNVRFDRQSPKGDNFSYEGWAGHYDLVKLNLHNENVTSHLLEAVEFWIDEFDIDGLRLDAADCVDIEFFKKLRTTCKNKKPDFWLYGEITSGEYNRWANESTLDSVTNYEAYKALYSCHNDRNYFEFAHSMDREFGDYGIYKNLYLYNFVDNHDVNRIASSLKDENLLFNVHTLLFTMPGAPSLYYGSEFGIKGTRTPHCDYDLRPCLTLGEVENPNLKLENHIIKLSKIRHALSALKDGRYKNENIQLEHFCFSRKNNEQSVFVLLNQSNETRNIGFNSGFCGVLTDVLNDKKTYPCDGYVSIDVSPKSSMILVSNGHNISIDFSDEIKNKPIEKIEKTAVEELYEEEIVLGKYRHFKGNEYEVVGFAKDSETTEKLVIYKALYGKQELWVRPYNMFREIIERDGKKLRRFTKI
ncbi:MAG: DUF1653 domain-containing protein [Ruminococcus sp.]|nr:DUF1653 domain-containing protein [Ruminococcus sp.]